MSNEVFGVLEEVYYRKWYIGERGGFKRYNSHNNGHKSCSGKRRT